MNLLDSWRQKVSRGASNAEQRKRETSSKASRCSLQQEETKRQYASICENELTRSLNSIIKKESTIS